MSNKKVDSIHKENFIGSEEFEGDQDPDEEIEAEGEEEE